MKIFSTLLIYLVLSLPSFCQKKTVNVSIDDMPLVTYNITDTIYKRQLMSKLVSALVRNNIPAIGFVNEMKLYRDNVIQNTEVKLLELWLDAGLALGNHTFAHQDYNNTNTREYFGSITRGEKVTASLLESRGRKISYFRHPFLHTGNSKQRFDSLNQFLLDHHYTVAPITIDDEDYVFALAYKRAYDKNDTKQMLSIGSDYVGYMEKKIKYYERQSIALFGRTISQTLLLHANMLNADYMDKLAEIFRANDYEFVSMETALQDPAYATPVTVYGTWGISWLDRWALSLGKKGEFFKEDPTTPEHIVKLAQ